MNIYDTLELFKELCHHATEVNIESLFNTIHHSFNEGYPEILFYRSFYTNGINNEYVYPENMIEVQLIYNVTMFVSLANTHTTKYNQEMTFETKPSLWQRFKNSKFVRAIKAVTRIRIVVDNSNALPEGRGEN